MCCCVVTKVTPIFLISKLFAQNPYVFYKNTANYHKSTIEVAIRSTIKQNLYKH